MLQEIRKKAPERGFTVGFGNISNEEESLEKLVDYALSDEGRESNTVTIIPYDNPYVQERLSLLKKSRVIFMNCRKGAVRQKTLSHITAIIGTGLAYVNGNNHTFMQLCRILTGTKSPARIEDVQENPADHVFFFVNIAEIDTEELKCLRERMQRLLLDA